MPGFESYWPFALHLQEPRFTAVKKDRWQVEEVMSGNDKRLYQALCDRYLVGSENPALV